MPIRTTTDAVQKLIELDDEAWDGCDASVFWDTCIRSASYLVDAKCVNPDTGVDYYAEDHMALIECWLAAHFAGVIDPSVGRLTVAQVASIREQYSFKVDLGLNQTVYGQQAIALDYKGGLASIQAKLPPKRKGRVVSLAYPTYTEGKVPECGGGGWSNY